MASRACRNMHLLLTVSRHLSASGGLPLQFCAAMIQLCGVMAKHGTAVMATHMSDFHMPPDTLLGEGMPLDRHMAGLGQGQLQHKAAAVVCYAAHDIQPSGSPRHTDWILQQRKD